MREAWRRREARGRLECHALVSPRMLVEIRQMAGYSLTITATVQNINFDAQLTDYNERSRYPGIQIPYPEARLTVKHLEVSLSEDQFAAVKKSVLEVF